MDEMITFFFFCLFYLALTQLQKFSSANQDSWDALTFNEHKLSYVYFG
jgi:hypothetical protein